MDVMKMPADLPDVTLNSNSQLVLKKRYQRKGLDGTPIETPREMFWLNISKLRQLNHHNPTDS